MDKEEIRELEPKFTGNQRHLTEGEAEAIKHDPANQIEDDDFDPAAAFGFFKNRGTL
ncbi:hypothetical protein RAC89_00215 [Paenibacillus sp. GD4]|jgi:hypothetical protein|uniref:hypothetical protein n=1 Tax=Paenibacillus TaxID=44249 RepID=UPI002543EA56|nr:MULTISPECIES: hypothetical protein [Paenibacillus]MDQ1908921.1 hypothetical protein [Paenibacillus sp. GD4]